METTEETMDERRLRKAREFLARWMPKPGQPGATFRGVPLSRFSREELMAMVDWSWSQETAT